MAWTLVHNHVVNVAAVTFTKIATDRYYIRAPSID